MSIEILRFRRYGIGIADREALDMKPKIGLLLGDRNGIGPEIAAKLLAEHDTHAAADVVVIADRGVYEAGQAVAGVKLDDGIEFRPLERPANETSVGTATASAGQEVLDALAQAGRMAVAGEISGFVFAPLNKQAMHMAGLEFEDEMQFLKHKLGFNGKVGELNVLGRLWTSRVTSHIAIRDVADHITGPAIEGAVALLDRSLRNAGFENPRLAVAALNPHAGDGGNFGREEIDVIEPAVKNAIAAGANAEGPYPADTIFVRAKNGLYDGVVTMYHDQGQIAMKMMGFGSGITVLGGLPVKVTTPAHGTAYDIAGKGQANMAALAEAWRTCARMATN
jgi:4-hydroxythreonine-4-phosphate dehydrogenase